MARPSKLTDETIEKICEAIRAGSYPESAAEFAGISVRTFWRWFDRGTKVRSGIYKRFVRAVQKAERDGEVALAAMVRKGAPKDWRAAAFLLERRYAERWARKEQVNVSGEVTHGGGVKIIPAKVICLPEEEPDLTRLIAAGEQPKSLPVSNASDGSGSSNGNAGD